MEISHRQSEALAWRAVAELARRHPEFEKIEFFWRIPGAGPPGYFVARFLIQGRWLYLGLFTEGTFASVSADRVDISLGLLTRHLDIRDWAIRVEELLRLTSPERTPATSRQAIGFRLVAEVLQRRLYERPCLTAMPANLSNSQGTDYEHPHCDSVVRALWGEVGGHGYATFLWHLLPVREGKAGESCASAWDALAADRAGPHGAGGSLEASWNDLSVAIQRGSAAPLTWIAPQRGLALDTSGSTVDLIDLYNANGRSLTLTSIALFG